MLEMLIQQLLLTKLLTIMNEWKQHSRNTASSLQMQKEKLGETWHDSEQLDSGQSNTPIRLTQLLRWLWIPHHHTPFLNCI